MLANSRQDTTTPSSMVNSLDNASPIKQLSSAAIAAARARAVQNGTFSQVTPTSLDSDLATSTIPSNPRGKLYNMDQVFKVWFENRDRILATTLPESARSESYKLAAPEPILHLELNAVASAKNASAELSARSMGHSRESLSSNALASVPVDFNADRRANPYQNSGYGESESGYGRASLNAPPAPPPGFGMSARGTTFDAPPKLLSPAEIKWRYIDPSGNEQGPFDGEMMHGWFAGGYLNMDLQICRFELSSFTSLRTFCESVRDFAQPFLVPLEPVFEHPAPPISRPQPLQLQPDDSQVDRFVPQQQPQSHSQFHPLMGNGPGQLGSLRLNPLLAPQSNLFGSDFTQSSDPFVVPGQANAPFGSSNEPQQSFGMENSMPFASLMSSMPSLLHQLIHQRNGVALPALSRTSSSWLLDGGSSLLQLGSPKTLAASLQPSGVTPMSPWIASVGVPPRVSSPFVHQPLDSPIDLSDYLDQRSVHTHLLEKRQAMGNSLNTSAQQPYRDNRPDTLSLDDIDGNVNTNFLNDGAEKTFEPTIADHRLHDKQAPAPAPAPASVPTVEASPQPTKTKPAASNPAPEPSQSQAAPENTETAPARIVNLKPAVAPEQKLAPWAAKAPVAAKPALTLKEIQALEAERMEKVRQEQLLLRMEQLQIEQAIEQEQLLLAAKQAALGAGLPKTSSWAVPKPVVSGNAGQKTLAQIQREEAEAAVSRAKTSKHAAQSAAAQSASFASTLASAPPRDENFNAWTTVAQKKAPVKKTVSTPMVSSTSSTAKLNPAVLRSVSAARSTPASNTAQLSREDCLVWARTAMTNLYPAVSKDDLLDIFVSMPSSLPDTMAVIAETIYALSATMDGRRFAQEFLKRKQKVDQQCGSVSDAAWLLAVETSAFKSVVVDDDGWSTSSKKKGKKPFQ